MTERKSIVLGKHNFVKRDISWMSFNERVIYQATRDTVPFVERLKFLGITESNLDEFVVVRYAQTIYSNRIDESELYHYEDLYYPLRDRIFRFKKLQRATYKLLVNEMDEVHNKRFKKMKELSKRNKRKAEDIFRNKLYPLIIPLTYDHSKEFPHIRSGQLTLIVGTKGDTGDTTLSIVPLDELERIHYIGTQNGKEIYMLVEDIVSAFLRDIFVNVEITYKGTMRLLRAASAELDTDENVYVVDRMRRMLIQRENGRPVIFEVSSDIPKYLLSTLSTLIGLDREMILKTDIPLDLSMFVGKPIRIDAEEYPPFRPHYPEELIGAHDMFSAIKERDIILHHPYDSFDPIIQFLEHAARDKQVRVIRQTLYRVSSEDSAIIKALCLAAENGKSVNVLLELKARFDESLNISLIDRLRESGCRVIYGFEELKTHGKLISVVRENEKGKLKIFTHFGTGNYNDITARVYTDLSLFTSNMKIGKDAIELFNIISGQSKPIDNIKSLIFSPYSTRKKLYSMIDREIRFASRGKPAYIIMKMNSLADKGIIEKLYEASTKGVRVDIICRGICSMIPINKNIRIKSIVGRFLEHSRVYYFHNNNRRVVYISSADLLTRNLDRRVEVMVPVTSTYTRNKVIRILKANLVDEYNSFVMDERGKYSMVTEGISEDAIDIHSSFVSSATPTNKIRKMEILE